MKPKIFSRGKVAFILLTICALLFGAFSSHPDEKGLAVIVTLSSLFLFWGLGDSLCLFAFYRWLQQRFPGKTIPDACWRTYRSAFALSSVLSVFFVGSILGLLFENIPFLESFPLLQLCLTCCYLFFAFLLVPHFVSAWVLKRKIEKL